jgi:riboflavin-specific deaminase-like protein
MSDLALGDRAPEGRPYVVLNMVSTLDGKATRAGRTAGIGSRADRELFHHLRTQADVVMTGAGTLRVERYGRIVRDPALREKRRRAGFAQDPLACVVSASMDGLADLPLFAAPEQRVIVLTGAPQDLPATVAPVDYVRAGRGAGAEVDLTAALGRLRSEHGVRSVLCEGGPTLNAELLRAHAVDELFLSLAPKLLGGAEALTIVKGAALPEPVELELVSMLEWEDELFLRVRVATPPAG